MTANDCRRMYEFALRNVRSAHGIIEVVTDVPLPKLNYTVAGA